MTPKAGQGRLLQENQRQAVTSITWNARSVRNVFDKEKNIPWDKPYGARKYGTDFPARRQGGNREMRLCPPRHSESVSAQCDWADGKTRRVISQVAKSRLCGCLRPRHTSELNGQSTRDDAQKLSGTEATTRKNRVVHDKLPSFPIYNFYFMISDF